MDTTLSGTLSLTTDRAVGNKAIKIDHSSTGYGKYKIEQNKDFDATKLPVVSLWVKPLTDDPLSFSAYDVTEDRQEKITSDQDGDGDFEIGEDLFKDSWNMVLLDLSQTQYGGIAKDARDLKIIINNSGTRVIVDGVNSLPHNIAGYDYDQAGNRETLNVNGLSTTYVYEAGNNLLKRRYNSLVDVSYDYDNEGNLIKQQIINQVTNIVNWFDYEYNELNQLTAVKRNDELIAEYSYDHQGLRYKKVDYVTGKTTIYIYGQGTEPVYEEVYSNDDLTTPVEKNSYLFMGTKRIAKDSDGKISYYNTDHLGSTRAIDDSGSLTRFDYAPFGEDLSANVGGYKFTGKEDDVSTGLYYYNARYYDPAIGKFITEDPAKDGGNWYVYCGNNPLVYVDPDGKRHIHFHKTNYHLFTNLGFGVYETNDNLSFHINKEKAKKVIQCMFMIKQQLGIIKRF